MRKRFVLLLAALLLLGVQQAFAQMSDSQVITYITEGVAAGKSERQIGTELMAKGVTTSQLQRLLKAYKSGNLSVGTDSGIMASNKLGVTAKERKVQPEEEDMLPYERECRITFETDVMPLSGTDENFDELFSHVEDEEEREELWNLLAIEGSRMGGYPYFIQNPVEVFESGEKGILLLQLDTDDEAGLMFGDCGNCQFFIAEQDLKNKDFSDVFYDWACC